MMGAQVGDVHLCSIGKDGEVGRKVFSIHQAREWQEEALAYISILCECDLRMLTTYYGTTEEGSFGIWLLGIALAGLAADGDDAGLGLAIGKGFGGLLAVLLDVQDESFDGDDSPEQRGTHCRV